MAVGERPDERRGRRWGVGSQSQCVRLTLRCAALGVRIGEAVAIRECVVNDTAMQSTCNSMARQQTNSSAVRWIRQTPNQNNRHHSSFS